MEQERLITMANQIARFFARQGGAEAVADHLRQFWDPRMRSEIARAVDSPLLDPVAASAVRLLNAPAEP